MITEKQERALMNVAKAIDGLNIALIEAAHNYARVDVAMRQVESGGHGNYPTYASLRATVVVDL